MMPVRATTKKELDWLSPHRSHDRVCHTISNQLPSTRRRHTLCEHGKPLQGSDQPAQKLQYKPSPDFVQPEFSCDANLLPS